MSKMGIARLSDRVLRQRLAEGMDAFIGAFVGAIKDAIGGELSASNIGELNSDQITLLGWDIMHDEVMDGGFVQLIHNGYAPFFFRNPFATAIRDWGLPELASLVNRAHKLYNKFGREIEKDCTDEEFMALFEQYPQFDALDDEFVESEEEWTARVAHYLDDHIDTFVLIDQ